MPLAQITILEGNDENAKRKLIANVTTACVEALNCTPEQVRVLITEMSAAHWGVGGLSVQDRMAPKG